MRQARWGTRICLGSVEQITSRYMRRAGYSRLHCGIVSEHKRALWASSGPVAEHAERLIARAAEIHNVPPQDVRTALHRVVQTTGRITLYHANINAEALIEAAGEDRDLSNHVVRVLSMYAGLNNEFTNSFFASDAGESLADEFGFARNKGQWFLTTYLDTCPCCDEYLFPNDNTCTVYQDGDLDSSYVAHWGCCEECDSIRRCDISGELFDEEFVCFATLEDTGDVVCVDYCMQRRLIQEDEDEYGDTVYYRVGNSSHRLAGYHNAPRPWLQDPRIPNGYVGVELELGFKRGDRDRTKFLEEFVGSDGRAKDGPFLFERDGSLEDVPGGMEIVSDPLALHAGYQAKDAPWRKLLADLYKAGGEGWKHRQLAGIHVNLCVREESDASIFKYASFISNAEAMSKFIAGRKSIYGTGDGYPKVPAYLLRGERIEAQMESQFARGKYSAVNRRDRNCLETRIFGSNIRYEGFMACVEYCVAVMEFVRPLHILDTSSPTISGEFRNWLGSTTQRFPNLSSRLGIVAHARGSAVPSTSRVTPVLLAA